jgi:hypothetical protein
MSSFFRHFLIGPSKLYNDSKKNEIVIVPDAKANLFVEQPLHIEEEEVPRFDVDDDSWLTYLEEKGYVVIANVANEVEIEEGKQLLWDFIQSKCDMQRNNPDTWGDERFQKIGSPIAGILAYGGINQSKFLWHARLLPSVKTAFSKLYKTDDLLTSFDGGNIYRPWHYSRLPEGEFWMTQTGWYHVDQGRKLRGFHCVQGLVSYKDANAQTGGFCVIPGSQKYHDELVDLASMGDANFVKVPGSFHALKEKQILPKVKAGDLILWDSRCIHANTPSLIKPIDQLEDDLLRIVAYVCMMPSNLASEDVIRNRINIFESGKGSTHWPHVIPYTCRAPETKTFELQNIDMEQKKLICGNWEL